MVSAWIATSFILLVVGLELDDSRWFIGSWIASLLVVSVYLVLGDFGSAAKALVGGVGVLIGFVLWNVIYALRGKPHIGWVVAWLATAFLSVMQTGRH